MSSTPSGSIDRRDAAVAAALAGAVVVVLGYASGVGIQTSGQSVLTQPPPVVQPAAPRTDEAAAPPVAFAQAPVLTAPAAIPVPVHEHARPAAQHHHTPAGPTPTPEPVPEPPVPPGCETGLLEGLPVAGPLAGATSALLFGVVRTVPVVGELKPVVCEVAELVAPACCATGAPVTRAEAGP